MADHTDPPDESELPALRATAGLKLYGKLVVQVKPWYLRLVERDIAVIRRFLPDAGVKKHYLGPLATDTLGTVAEIFAIARSLRLATSFVPHSPSSGGSNFDGLLRFGTSEVGIEVKHRRDHSPFDGREIEVEGGLKLYESERPGADPKISGAPLSPRFTKNVPASTIWRDVMEDAASQLRRDIPGIIAVSIDDFGGFEDDLVSALLGDPHFVATLGPNGSTISEERYDNGVFLQESFHHVRGVWFFKLHPEQLPQSALSYASMCQWARFAPNPHSRFRDLPCALATSLFDVHDRLLKTPHLQDT